MWTVRLAALLAAALAWLAGAAPAAAQTWLKAESPHFIVYGMGDEARLREQAALLEDYDGLLRLLTGAPDRRPAGKLHVYMVRGGGLRTVRPGLPIEVAGFYAARPGGIAAFVDERVTVSANARAGRHEVLFHEYAHHFMAQYFPAAYPAWYVEGFAEFMMTARFDGNSVEYGGFAEGRARQVAREWASWDHILFPDPRTPVLPSEFYAQSWILVHYLFTDQARRAALTDYLVALNQGEEPRPAFERAFGMTARDLNAALSRYVRGGVPMKRMARSELPATPPIAVTALPPSARDLLLLEAALRIGTARADAPATLARVRRAAAAHEGDAYARRVLAHAEALLGDGEVAERLLGELIAAQPGDAELLYLMGMRHLRAAREADDSDPILRRARPWFVRVHRADPNHFPTLYRYAEALRGQDSYRSENTANILRLAHQLAPQVSEIRLAAATMLMSRGEFDEAVALLGPLAANSHAGGLAAAARLLIEKARARERPGDPPIGEKDEEAR
jgi:tetratricopeptide (TPR) repeat protein